ncbi:MAG TPA: NAD-dependent epimerase/dehydratase family protein, partial [Chroococcales cyanobacterium]
MMGKILLIGSTGTVGSLLFSRLEERGERVKGATRNPEEARKKHEEREYVAFDFEDSNNSRKTMPPAGAEIRR